MRQRCQYAYQTIKLGYLFEIFWLYMTIALNLCLCLDLFLMIRYPFAKKDKLMNIYVWVSLVASIVVSIKSAWATNIIFLVTGVGSSIFAFSFLNKPGISREIRSLVLKRHISSIVFFFVADQYVILSCLMVVMYPSFSAQNDYWWTKTLKVIFYTQGYFMPFIRCQEPAFVHSF